MLFYMQMRWNIEGRLSFKEVWDLEIEESESREGRLQDSGHVQSRRPATPNRDCGHAFSRRTIMGRLPLREFLEFEAIWPVRPFENFLEDCRTHFGTREMNA
jgi:muconolactone D-isomerase